MGVGIEILSREIFISLYHFFNYGSCLEQKVCAHTLCLIHWDIAHWYGTFVPLLFFSRGMVFGWILKKVVPKIHVPLAAEAGTTLYRHSMCMKYLY
jgi:hypothetical protein